MQSADPPKLPAGFREKLAKLLGMTGSNSDAEALSAARLADRLVREAGATWSDVVVPPATPAPQLSVLAAWPARWRGALQICLHARAVLSDRERTFVANLTGYQQRPSPRQLDWLRAIVERVLAGAAS